MIDLRIKNNLVLLLACAGFIGLLSCVDNKYDLADVDTDEIVIGDEIVAPLGTGSISVDKFLDFDKIENLKEDSKGYLLASYTGMLEVKDLSQYLTGESLPFAMRNINLMLVAEDAVDLSDLSTSFGGNNLVLSLKGMNLVLKTATNVSVTIPSLLELVPAKNQQTLPGTTIPFDVKQSAEGQMNTYWVGTDIKQVPQGYTFVENNELNGLLAAAPSTLGLAMYMDFLSLDAATLPTDKLPYARLNYEVNVPLIPAPGFKAVVNEVVKDAFDEDFVDYLFSGGTADIYGEVSNGIPLQLAMKMIITNERDLPVGIDMAAQEVTPCDANGAPTVSAVTYTIAKQDMNKMKNAKNIRIELTASGSDATGNIGLHTKQQINLKLKLRKTGGIHINSAD